MLTAVHLNWWFTYYAYVVILYEYFSCVEFWKFQFYLQNNFEDGIISIFFFSLYKLKSLCIGDYSVILFCENISNEVLYFTKGSLSVKFYSTLIMNMHRLGITRMIQFAQLLEWRIKPIILDYLTTRANAWSNIRNPVKSDFVKLWHYYRCAWQVKPGFSDFSVVAYFSGLICSRLA